MRWPCLSIALAACAPSSRADDGVWEVPATWISGVAGDSTTLWVLSRDPDVAVTRYSFDGVPLGPPVVLADRAWAEAVAAGDTGAVAAYTDDRGAVYALPFDHQGRPSYASARSVAVGGHGIALAMSPTGGSRILVGGVASSNAVTLAELDLDGALVGTPVPLGTREPDEYSSVAIGTKDDGTSVLAWDRTHDRCFDTLPFSTFTTTVDAARQLSPLETVRDQPERDETAPVVAARDDGVYVAWRAGWEDTIALARSSQLQTPIEIHSAVGARLALASGHDGAIAWRTSDGLVSVATFEDQGAIVLGESRLFGRAYDQTGEIGLVALVHAGDRRYVLVWNEASGEAMRSFARTVDFDAPAEPAPDRNTAPRTLPRPAPPCSH